VSAAATIRILGAGDERLLEPFFAAHPDTTLFFQNNVFVAGLADRGQPYQGTYAAALEGERLVALAAHYWQGNLIVEAPVALAEVARAAIAASGRPVAGLLGPWAQVAAARATLSLGDAAATMDSPDDLFALDLAALRVPPPLARGAVVCRSSRADEIPIVAAWRYQYRIELMGEPPGDDVRAMSRDEIERSHAEGRNFVLERDGALVSYAGYNAALPHCVQIGGVWTPREHRGRGYARAAVAGALLAARARGVARSILFTGVDNRAAQAAYRALGYERVGDYGLVLFAAPAVIR
jgi:RimJ/RimL family protein N-acetyltransferase